MAETGKIGRRAWTELEVVAEAPGMPTNGEPWPEVPERSVIEVTPDLRLPLEPLEEA
jgi:hypothetical protein